MHGLIFHKLQRYCERRFNPEAWNEVVKLAGPLTWDGDMSHCYPDGEFAALLNGVATLARQPVGEIMEHFGFNLVPSLLETASVLGLIKPEWRTLEVIKHAPDLIHPMLQAANPRLSPPFLLCEFTADGHLLVAYRSPRQACQILRGIVRGIAAHYRQNLSVTEEVCVLKGGAGCRFRLEMTSAPAASKEVGVTPSGMLYPRSEVHLFNTFRGIPITYPGLVMAATRSTAQVQTHKNQLVAVQDEGTTLLSTLNPRRTLQAKVKRIDWPRQLVELEKFGRIHVDPGKRNCIRVGMKEAVRAEVMWQDKPLRGLLRDISESGMAMVLPSYGVGQEILFSEVSVIFFLPARGGSDTLGGKPHAATDLEMVETTGDVVGVVVDPGEVVLRIRFKTLSASQRNVIEQFIMQRQLKVLRELRELVK